MIKIKAQNGSYIGSFMAPAVPSVGDTIYMQPGQPKSTVTAVIWERSGPDANSPLTPLVVLV